MIYLDNAATTQVDELVLHTMIDSMKNCFGNPSSLHKLGIESEKKVKTARQQIADGLATNSKNIIFTSGGTESNNLAILGHLATHKDLNKIHCITTCIEHPSVMNVFKHLESCGASVTYLPVNDIGQVDCIEFKEALQENTVLISVMYVNNEIGIIQPIVALAQIAKRFNPSIIFHVDAIQALGVINIKDIIPYVDLLSISSHKIHGPKGVGALYVKNGVKIKPLVYGGGQEIGVRNGTENLSGIIGFGKAVSLIDVNKNQKKVMELKLTFLQKLLKAVPQIVIHGGDAQKCAPHILSIGVAGLQAEVIQHMLELEDIYIGTGSACSSHKKGMSHVLKAINTPSAVATGTLRISFSKKNTIQEIETASIALAESMTRFLRMVKK